MEKNIFIGKNNYISKKAIIYDNVKIGNNNKIYDDVIIYPNTIIGDNNIFFNGNIIGEYPVQSNGSFQDYDFTKTYGVIIGNNNFFHIKNIVFCGTEVNTTIGNNNKILCDCHINHDCFIGDNVTMYPRSTLCGFVKCLNNSNIGGAAFIHQKKIIGQYSMIGANNFVGKNVFPYYIFINNKCTRLNTLKIPNYIKENEIMILNLMNDYYKKRDIDTIKLPIEIKYDLDIFLES